MGLDAASLSNEVLDPIKNYLGICHYLRKTNLPWHSSTLKFKTLASIKGTAGFASNPVATKKVDNHSRRNNALVDHYIVDVWIGPRLKNHYPSERCWRRANAPPPILRTTTVFKSDTAKSANKAPVLQPIRSRRCHHWDTLNRIIFGIIVFLQAHVVAWGHGK